VGSQPPGWSSRPLPAPVQPLREAHDSQAGRLSKEVPKRTGSAGAPDRSGGNGVSLQKKFDLELMAGLRKGLQFIRGRLPRLPYGFWSAIPRRRLVLSAVVAAGLFLIAPYTPLSRWSNDAIASLEQSMKERAAFQVIDDFTSGVSAHWDAAGMVSDDSGAARVTGFALNRSTMGLTGYRLDFDAKIASRGLGWVVGAEDEKNYYAFKIEDGGSRKQPQYRLVRYLVAEGEEGSERVQVNLPAALDVEGFNRISVRLRENRIATFINGTGVDYWQAEETPQGGVGFFTEGGATAFVRRVEVSGNEDTWGLFLFGFLELLEDAKGFVEPVTARFLTAPPDESGTSLQLDAPDLAKAM
jgi:hypothetical protein